MSLTNIRVNDALSGRSTGAQSIVLSFFGTDGQKDLNDTSAWSRFEFVEWKSFCLRTVDHSGTYGAGAVQIHAAMSLKEGDEANTEFVILDTLNAGNRTYETEDPWRYIRCKITAAFTKEIVVEAMGINR